jgi:uncharacterized phage protein gp47/JayE
MVRKSYREILEAMRNYIIAHQNRATDFNEGSVILSLVEGYARELAALYIKAVSNIELYAKDMAFAQFDFEKKDGLAAGGSVVFSRKTASGMAARIPQGALISAADGLQFETTAAGDIAAGAVNSGDVPVSCTKVGRMGNVNPQKVNAIVNAIYGVDAVINNAAMSGGVDIETDEEYSERFSEFIIGLGKSSVSGVRATALSINGVRSVSVVEHFPNESGYHFTLFAENGSGALPTAVKAKIEEVIIGDDDTEGVRACGVNARVLAPQIVTVSPNVLFRVDGAIPAGLIEDALKTKITNYVNSLKIGVPYEMKNVYNMVIRQAGVKEITSITPATTTPTLRQIIRAGTVTVEGV